MFPRDLEKRLLPIRTWPAPEKPVKVLKNKNTVICLPDRSGERPISLPPKRAATTIIREVCDHHKVSMSRFLSDDRLRDVVCARRHAYYRIATETQMTIAAIGRFVNRDHTTVIHALQQYCHQHKLPYPRERLNHAARNRGKSLQREYSSEVA